MERPALEQLFERIREGAVQRIVVYRMDRLTRNVADWAALARLVQRFDVGLTVTSGALDADGTALANLQLNVLASFAQFERELFGDRLRDARAARKARGLRSSGRVAFGFKPHPRTKQLEVVPEHAELVRWFFEQAAADRIPSEIAQLANTRGDGRWSARRVLRLLQNPVYIGKQPDCATGAHTAIINVEQFQRVQALIRDRRSREPSPRAISDDGEDPFLLRGLVVCGCCRNTMTTSAATPIGRTRRSPTYRYYRCRTPRCEGGQIAADVIEDQAVALIRRPSVAWETSIQDRFKRLASIWDFLTPPFRRRFIVASFEKLIWRPRSSRVYAKPLAINDDQEPSGS